MTKTKYGCETAYATCLITEASPNTQTTIVDTDCISQYEANEDFYSQLEDIQSQSDLSELGESCLTYVKVGGKLFVKNAILKMEEEICLLKERVLELEERQVCDIPISECLIDSDCLVGSCDNSIVTLKDWMQAVQTKICIP